MSKKIILPIILLVAIFVGYSIYKQMQPGEDTTSDSPIILYYSYSCPHCKIVEDFLAEKNISEKVPFSTKEIYKNKENAKELTEKAKLCGISEQEIGVPLLWDGEKCLVGDKDIIDFFNQKIENQTSSENAEEKCKKLEETTSLEIKKIADEAGYCDSDSDCTDEKIILDCPFSCQTYLVNKNADISKINDLTNKYYEDCPKCSAECQTQKVMDEYIKCYDKKCEIQYPDNSDNMEDKND